MGVPSDASFPACHRKCVSYALYKYHHAKELDKQKMSATPSLPANQESSHWEAEEQLFMDAGDLQSLLASISALFPRCQESGTCQCCYCRPDTTHFSTSGDARQDTPLPPPSRYSRRPRRASLPPKGPACAGSDSGRVASGPADRFPLEKQ